MQIMVAGIRCQQMVDEQLAALSASSVWADLRARAMSGSVVEGFGRAAAALLQAHLQG